jgi:transcriptional regulator
MSTKEQRERIELLQGTLDLLILRTLLLGPAHGHAIAKAIEFNSDDVLQVEQGSLYPALHRLEKRGWLEADWGESDKGRQAKFYKLSAKGRKQLAMEEDTWNRLSRAVALILETAR